MYQKRGRKMKVIVVGGVAAGTKAAAKLKREDRNADIRILTKGKDISYAGCGLPYYVSGVIREKKDLLVHTPESYEKVTGVPVEIRTEVTKVDRKGKTVEAVNLDTGAVETYAYDKLVIATGARPFEPDCPGTQLKNVFYMRTPEDADMLRQTVEAGEIRRAVIVGGGFIGLEIAENLAAKDVKVSVIDFAPHILPGFLDPEIADYVENKLADAGVMCFTGTGLEEILGEEKVEKVKTSRRAMKADACILAMGIRPNTEFLQDAGLEMFKGVLLTNQALQTNDPDIYAVGDCAMVTNRITGKPQWSPMGSTANIAGRAAAQHLAGKTVQYPGVLGTGVAKLAGFCMGRTGLLEQAAREAGYDAESVICVVDDKAHYYPGAALFVIKLIADRESHRLLGMQTVGTGAVDKLTDIAVTAISMKATLEDLQYMDFAYAPPFSTAIHPLQHAVNILLNKLNGELDSMTAAEYAEEGENYRIVDAGITPSLHGYPYVDLNSLDGPADGLGRNEKLLLVCSKGKRAYLVQNRLKAYGYTDTKVLEGGMTFHTELKEEE